MTITPEQIAAAKTAYEQALEVEKAAAKIVTDITANSAATVNAYQQAKAAFDALKPSQALAKAKLDRAAADVKIARAEYQAVAPKEVAADTASRKGTGNKELLIAVAAFLADKPDGATNTEIYDALLSGGIEMAGADPRANLTSYLSRWGSAGSLVSKGTGKWGVGTAVAPAVAPSFLAAPAAPSFAPVEPAAPAFAPVPMVNATDTAPAVLAPVETPVNPDLLGEDFPGYDPLVAAGVTTKTQLATATHEQLVTIPGIGAKTAAKIIESLAV